MKKFIALYMMPAATLAKMGALTPEDMQSEMKKWMAWGERHRDAIVDFGAPLGKTKRITATGVSDAKNELTGYTIVKAESADAAAKIFADNPHFSMGEGGTVELVECLDVPGM